MNKTVDAIVIIQIHNLNGVQHKQIILTFIASIHYYYYDYHYDYYTFIYFIYLFTDLTPIQAPSRR